MLGSRLKKWAEKYINFSPHGFSCTYCTVCASLRRDFSNETNNSQKDRLLVYFLQTPRQAEQMGRKQTLKINTSMSSKFWKDKTVKLIMTGTLGQWDVKKKNVIT